MRGNTSSLKSRMLRIALSWSMPGKELQTEHVALESGVTVPAGSHGGEPAEEWDIRPLDEVTADYIAAAVKASGGNLRKAARLLSISPSTLYARLKSMPKNS